MSKSKNRTDGDSLLSKLLMKAEKAAFPQKVEPMLATLITKPFDEEGWLYEVKWDGYRAVSLIHNGEVDILSRNNKSFNEKFYPLPDALRSLQMDIVLDGEIVVINEKGYADFSLLQGWRSEADGALAYYVFDILWFDGFNLMQLPLVERKEILSAVIRENNTIRISQSIKTTATEFFSVAKEMQLEGIMAKRSNSIYIPGNRSKDWLKIKTEKRQEAVIGGFTKNENTSKAFSALLMGVFNKNGDFDYIGPVGTGFSNQMQQEILEKLKPLIIEECPFSSVPDYNKPSRFRPNPPKAEVVWVKPEVIAEISYRTLTDNGNLRHPSFKGLRDDKNPAEVVKEIAEPTSKITNADENALTKNIFKMAKKERKTLLNPTDETQVRKISGEELKFTSLSKIYWPELQITKRDMINYYYQIAPFILPYLKNRPQTLNRFPNGIDGQSFYQKNVTGKVPDWIETFPYHSDTDGEDKNFLVCTNEASLLYIASLGCIEINPWSSKTTTPDNPDWCIIDLDPDKHTFDQVIEAAQVTRKVLDAIGVPSFCKTSGSTGLHIYIPLGAKYSYEESKEFARIIVTIVHHEIPEFTSIERIISNRKGKMYLDFLQNRPQATLAAPYSLRPKPTATASTPLHWDEVKKGLKMTDFTISNLVERTNREGDLFKGVLGKGINLKKVLQKINSTFGEYPWPLK